MALVVPAGWDFLPFTRETAATEGKYVCDRASGLPVKRRDPRGALHDVAWYEYPVAYAWCAAEYNSPSAWGGAAGNTAANVYEGAMYGEIPRPAELPLPPGPGAPVDPSGIDWRTWNLEQQAQADASAWERWQRDYQQALIDAERSGSWTPEGGGDKWLLVAALVGVGVLVLMK